VNVGELKGLDAARLWQPGPRCEIDLALLQHPGQQHAGDDGR